MDEKEAQAVKLMIECFYALKAVEDELYIPRGGVHIPSVGFYGEFVGYSIYKRRPQWEPQVTLVPFVESTLLEELSVYLKRRVELGGLMIHGALVWVWAKKKEPAPLELPLNYSVV